MDVFKLNPGYFPNEYLQGYNLFLASNSHTFKNIEYVRSIVKAEMEIRALPCLKAKELNLKKSFNVDEIIFSENEKRISSPLNLQQIWAQHKYSVLARDHLFYKQTGSFLSGKKGLEGYKSFLEKVSDIILQRPNKGSLFNSVLHMWGYLPVGIKENINPSKKNMHMCMKIIADFSLSEKCLYLKNSTALSDFYYWTKFYSE